MKGIKNAWRLSALGAAAVLLAACGSDGGGNSSPAAQTGVLVDAPVAGVRYVASPSGLSGETTATGGFQYRAGDEVTFSVGGIVIGSAPGTPTITPLLIAANSDWLSAGVTPDAVALNIAIFLQSFDSDDDPDTITIADEVVTAANGDTLNFLQETGTFVTDGTLTALAADAGDYEVVSETAAAEHVTRTLTRALAGSWKLADRDTPADYNILNIFPNGAYALGHPNTGHDDACGAGVERGMLEIDGLNMSVQAVSVDVDNTGAAGVDTVDDCGLYENGAGVQAFIESISDNTIDIVIVDTAEGTPETPFTLHEMRLTRIVNNGVTGSWTEYGEENQVVSVVSLLGDGKYMVAQLDNGSAGLETGTWSRNASNELTATVAVDTNGDAGLSGIVGATTVTNGNFGLLRITVAGEGSFNLFPVDYKLQLAGYEAYSSISNSACPGVPGGFNYDFTSTGMNVVGSDSWDGSCALGASQAETWAYDEFEGPFSCGGPVCDYFDFNKVIVGTDTDGRGFTSTTSHVPGTHTVTHTKEITSGDGAGTTFTETFALQLSGLAL